MLNAIIIEDEPKVQEALRHLLTKHCPDVQVVATANSVNSAVKAVREHLPDILFLDVELADGNCFEILQDIPEFNFDLIFITAHNHYAIQAIKYSALDYLLKPLVIDELKTAVEKARTKSQRMWETAEKVQTLRVNLEAMQAEDGALRKIALPTLEGFTFVEIENIIRCEADGNCTRLYVMEGAVHTVSKRLQVYEDMLAEHNFFRVHNSHLVNLAKVKKYVKGRGGYIVMSDGAMVDVAARKKDAFLQKLVKV